MLSRLIANVFAYVLFGCLSLPGIAHADSSLWMSEPDEVAITVGNMSPIANRMGLTYSHFEGVLQERMTAAGLVVKRGDRDTDEGVVHLDLIVDTESFVVSVEFWRQASYRLPNGDEMREYLPVWDKYVVGVHANDRDVVRSAVDQVIGVFIREYRQSNTEYVSQAQ